MKNTTFSTTLKSEKREHNEITASIKLLKKNMERKQLQRHLSSEKTYTDTHRTQGGRRTQQQVTTEETTKQTISQRDWRRNNFFQTKQKEKINFLFSRTSFCNKFLCHVTLSASKLSRTHSVCLHLSNVNISLILVRCQLISRALVLTVHKRAGMCSSRNNFLIFKMALAKCERFRERAHMSVQHSGGARRHETKEFLFLVINETV